MIYISLKPYEMIYKFGFFHTKKSRNKQRLDVVNKSDSGTTLMVAPMGLFIKVLFIECGEWIIG